MTARARATKPPVIPEAKADGAAKVTFVGIDPGLKGGIAWINPDSAADARPMPIAEYTNGRRGICRDSLKMLLTDLDRPVFVAIELVNAAPMRGRRQGTTSMFNFGREFGVLIGTLNAMDIPFIEAEPKKWKRAVLSGTRKDKTAAIGYVQRFYPAVDLKASPRCRVFHDGMADAVCLAEYARQAWKIQELTGVNR